MNTKSRHQRLLLPLLILLAALGLCGYGTVAALSQDPLWFLGRTAMPDPRQIILRVDGQEITLTPTSPGYDLLVDAARRALSSFDSLAPRSLGLSEQTLAEYDRPGAIVLELYFDKPVDFHLPFNDGQPTALLIPIQGRHAGHGYLFRGKHGQWWAGQLVMHDPQPLLEALSTLGYR